MPRKGTYLEKNTSGKITRRATLMPSKDKAMSAFYETVDQPRFLQAVCSASGKWASLASVMLEPKFKHNTFANLCRKFNITPNDLLEFWRSHQRIVAEVHTLNELPEITKQVAEDAQHQPAYCERCDGLGKLQEGFETVEFIEGEEPQSPQPIERECPKCKGTGQVEAPADRHARDLVYKSQGLIDKAPMIPIQLNFGVPLEDTVSRVGKILDITPVGADNKGADE